MIPLSLLISISQIEDSSFTERCLAKLLYFTLKINWAMLKPTCYAINHFLLLRYFAQVTSHLTTSFLWCCFPKFNSIIVSLTDTGMGYKYQFHLSPFCLWLDRWPKEGEPVVHCLSRRPYFTVDPVTDIQSYAVYLMANEVLRSLQNSHLRWLNFFHNSLCRLILLRRQSWTWQNISKIYCSPGHEFHQAYFIQTDSS